MSISRRLASVFCLSTVVFLASCTNGFMTPPAQPGTTTPPAHSVIGSVAIYGRQFVVAGDGALTGLDFVIGAGIIDRSIGVSILTVMKRTGDEAVRLAGVLRILDQTSNALERASLLQKAQAIVAGIGALFDDSIITINDPRTRTIVAAILQTTKALVTDFNKTLGSGADALDLEAQADGLEYFAAHYATQH